MPGEGHELRHRGSFQSIHAQTAPPIRSKYTIGHYVKRFTAMESTFGDTDRHLAALARGLI